MRVGSISWSISTKECCRPRQRLNPRPGLQSDGASNWSSHRGQLYTALLYYYIHYTACVIHYALYATYFITKYYPTYYCDMRSVLIHLLSCMAMYQLHWKFQLHTVPPCIALHCTILFHVLCCTTVWAMYLFYIYMWSDNTYCLNIPSWDSQTTSPDAESVQSFPYCPLMWMFLFYVNGNDFRLLYFPYLWL